MKKRNLKKKKNSFWKKFKGFTLVELLAVIVILAIIMLIAIPAVLDSLESARKKTFIEFATKTYDSSIKVRLDEELNNSALQSCVIYNIKNDLNLSTTGDYSGYVLYTNINNVPKYYIVLYDKNYIIGPALYNDENFNVSKLRRYNNESDDNLKSALALEGECINYTNKGDGSSNSSIPENGISKKLKPGDRVRYYPTETSYTPDPNLTGCGLTDECDSFTLNPSAVTNWVVMSVNDDGTVDIVGKSPELYYLWGLTGYKNSLFLLREASSHYGDNRFMKSIRPLGDEGEPDFIEDSSIDDLRANISRYYLTRIDDDHYEAKDVLTLGYWDRSDLLGTYLASRDREGRDNFFYGVCVRTVFTRDGLTYCGVDRHKNPLFGKMNSCSSGDYDCKFMSGNVEGYTKNYLGVVVTLKANVKVASGNGTSSSPYELTF